MAKIALISPQITTSTWKLALDLRAQNHQVTIITSRREEPLGDLINIELMNYFKSWSFWEGMRLIPVLLMQRFSVMHFFLGEDKLNGAIVALATFAKNNPDMIIATSLLHIHRGLKRHNPTRYLVENSDILTLANTSMLGHLRGLNMTSDKQGRGILPPALLATSAHSIRSVDMRFKNNFKTLIIPLQMPRFSPTSEYFQSLKILSSSYNLVLWGTTEAWPLREKKQLAHFFEGEKTLWKIYPGHDFPLADGLFLAGLSYSPAELTELYRLCIEKQLSLILDSQQAFTHGTLWNQKTNAWILDQRQILRDLSQKLAQGADLCPPPSQDHVMHQHLVDTSLNDLNRLYNKALSQLRSP